MWSQLPTLSREWFRRQPLTSHRPDELFNSAIQSRSQAEVERTSALVRKMLCSYRRSMPPRRAPGRAWATTTGVEVMGTELDKFYSFIADIKIAMMTTRRPDGHLESQAMANQKRAEGADLWFVTAEGSGKPRDLARDPHVNLAYYKAFSYEWVSASGVARLSRDRRTIHKLYEPDWKEWLDQEGDPRHGTADDPRIILIGIDVQAAVFLEVNKPKPVVLFGLANGWLTGERVEPGEIHEQSEAHR